MIVAISVFFIAMAFSMFGMGGGLFYMPLFLLFIDSFREASTLSFLCILVTSFSAMLAYHRENLIDWRLVKYLGIPLVVMIFIAGFAIKLANVIFLRAILGLTLFSGGILMIFPLYNYKISTGLAKYFPDKKYRITPIVLIPVSLAIGFLSGMAGVAGGVFEIPLMVGILGVSAHMAAASSSAILVLAAISGFLGRFFSNNLAININLELLVVLFCAFLGAQIGPRISLRLNKQIFKRICGAFILLIGTLYILKR